MFELSIQNISFWLVVALTWIVIMLGVIQLSRFFSTFQEVRRDLEGNMLGIAGQIKQLQSSLSETLGEQRRVVRVLNELLELKRAEMTGDFDIVEEPIPAVKAAGGAPQGASAEAETAENANGEKLAPPPNKFPKL